MRIVRTLALLAATAIAALAFAATANAQEESLTVLHETEGTPCNPCNIHVTGNSSLVGHSGGVEVPVSVCEDEFIGDVFSDGSAHVTSISLQGDNCNSIPCGDGSGGQEEWPGVLGEVMGEEEHLVIDFCLVTMAGNTHCEIEVDVHEEESNNHHYLLTVNDFTCPSGVEVNGDWETEHGATAFDAIELVH